MCDITPIEWQCDVTDWGCGVCGLWIDPSIHPSIHPSIETVKPPASGTHSFYWPIVAKGMSYHGMEKSKLRFDDKTRGGEKKSRLHQPPHFQCNCPHWKRVVGTMEFVTISIILQFGWVWRLLVYLLDSFPWVWCLGCCWTPTRWMCLINCSIAFFEENLEVELDCIEINYHSFFTGTFVIHLCELHSIMPQVS
jgi:hypothetical protein